MSLISESPRRFASSRAVSVRAIASLTRRRCRSISPGLQSWITELVSYLNVACNQLTRLCFYRKNEHIHRVKADSTDHDKSSRSHLCSAVPFSVYDFSLVLRGPWLQRLPRDYVPHAFVEASFHFIPFFIGECTKDEVVFIRLVFLLSSYFKLFSEREIL